MKVFILIFCLFLSITPSIAAIYPESPRECVEEKIVQLDIVIEKLECGNDLKSANKNF